MVLRRRQYPCVRASSFLLYGCRKELILRQVLNPARTSWLKKALGEPETFLGRVQDRRSESDLQQVPHPPDICAAYRLYRDAGKLVNLCDWQGAFDAVIEVDASEETDEGVSLASSPTRKRPAPITNGHASPTKRRPRKRRRRVNASDEELDGEDLDEEVSERIRLDARFLRAVGDMGFMGFVTATRRKPEHVNRMIW